MFGMDGIEAELDREELIALVSDLRKVIVELRKRVEELEGKIPTECLGDSYSLRAEERRQNLKLSVVPNSVDSSRFL